MTLILSIPAKDGVVLASDSQLTIGPVRTSGTKVFTFNKHLIWGASGESAFIQRVKEHIEAFTDRDKRLSYLRDSFSKSIKESVETLLGLDFLTQFFRGDPDSLLKLHPGDFVFAEYKNTPQILHITSNGTAEWVNDQPLASGSGALFAYTLLCKYENLEFNIITASILAYKVIDEAIKVGSYGLGHPIDIWQITKKGSKQLKDEDKPPIADVVGIIREMELDIFQRMYEKLAQKPGNKK